jgi:hypothetical protein
MNLLKFSILLVISSFVVAAPRKFDEVPSSPNSNFVMIGNSKGNYKKLVEDNDEKVVRSSYQHRPSSDYHHAYFQPPPSFPPAFPSPSLITANVNLLEPFMIMTFLMFVVSLVDKLRLPLAPRSDFIREIPLNFTDISDEHFNQHQQRFLKLLNETRNF